MSRTSDPRRILTVLVACVHVAASADEPEGAFAILDGAFKNQYEVGTSATVELVMRSSAGSERRRSLEAASKIIGDRMHSIGRVTKPEHLRGMTILQIEAAQRGHDTFIYFPSNDRVRRVSTAQRDDSLLGTDVIHEDLERRRASSYDILDMSAGTLQQEEVLRVRVRPRDRRTYSEAVFFVARADSATLRVEYYGENAEAPYRVVVARREDMRTGDGHVLPDFLVIENRRRRTTTEVTYRRLKINPELDDRIFSIRTLEQQRPLGLR